MDDEKQPFWVHCGKCQHEFAPCFLPVSAESFGKMRHTRCPMCGSKDIKIGEFPKPTNEGDPVAWLANGDTGISSKTIWFTLMNRTAPIEFRPDVPHDPSDFGRCYRLLKVMPSWRSRLPEVAEKHKSWRPLVAAWDELTALYEQELPTGMAPKLYARMRALIEGA
jgi:DNA-directed RNA polymerase subunit RPC12/RpoP